MSNRKLRRLRKFRRAWRIIFNTVQNAKKPHLAGSKNTAVLHFKTKITEIPQEKLCKTTNPTCPPLEGREGDFHNPEWSPTYF